jgi:hypothetical protein
MFFTFPIQVGDHIRQVSLLLNTIVLIGVLIVVELVYAERPKQERVHLRYFLPFVAILVGLLVYAAVLQTGRK